VTENRVHFSLLAHASHISYTFLRWFMDAFVFVKMEREEEEMRE
jgi:1-acyl-sn-glycerol-3-phosphate acyltransferase